ncbi:TPA_asm: amidase [Listeria monocytogenes]|uniref:Amidase n=1 Tax=Listeria monocytogenes TaxID=1639 RepID=A0A3T2CMB8_LISMN|nr:amidase family protein [Listeria monocytogenes]EAF3058677.1 amidase [Listeria monocytogenes serotype 1/2a]AEO02943.1 amidase [Listeria monocytogenes J0161]AQP64548.1 amidase [Listeria monocytogenes]EAA0271281.1 amidase [Listeria monocytogenes]EAC2500833.1 amidase [Listeria monocytogenes]
MKKRFIIISVTIFTTFGVIGIYLFFMNQETSAPKKNTTVAQKAPTVKKDKEPTAAEEHKKVGINKENIKLEANFGNNTLEVNRLTGKVSQEDADQSTVIHIQPTTKTQKKSNNTTTPKSPNKPAKKPKPNNENKTVTPPSKNIPFYDKERVMAPINAQLATLDLEILEEKEPLVVGADITKLQNLIATKQLSYKELAGIYLNRIKKYDQNGITLNAISEINPSLVAEAEQLDQLAETNKSALYGMPVVLKDNIGTITLPTSAGTVALKDWVMEKDAAIVDKLKTNGALILGKTNMSEWAAAMDDGLPNGYSGKKGLSKNPYSSELDPLGSSSGSATAATCDFAAIAIGTETNGSIILPAGAQSVVGFKPSQGLVSNEGIIPLSSRFDTPGPLTRTVTDAYLTTNVLMDEASQTPLSKDALKNKRIGILSDDESNEETAILKKIKKDLTNAGATVIEGITLEELEQVDTDYITLLNADFKRDLNQFLQINRSPMSTLESIIAFNKINPTRNMKFGQSELVASQNNTMTKQEADNVANELIHITQNELDSVLQNERLDAIVSAGVGGSVKFLAPIAGNPELTIPAGYDTESNQPKSLTFVSKRNTDIALLNMGYAYEQISKNRKNPVLTNQ